MFNLLKSIKQSMKLLLIYRKGRKELNLKDYKLYASDRGDGSILESENKSLIDVVNLWLVLSICATSTFYQALVKVLKSQFVNNSELSNAQHNRQHICNVITLNKMYNIYLGPYHLDTFSSLVLSMEVIDKVVRYYLCLLLAQADDFYRAQIEHKIA